MNLNLRGEAVIRVCFDAALTILTSGDCELRVEGEAVLHVPGGDRVAFDPCTPDIVAPYLVRLARDVISQAEVGNSGELGLEFESGVKLTVQPDDDYEAWGLVGPRRRRVICTPGGEIAVWSEE
ncbi:DUF6188 family protein [Streptomyces sp. CA-288835]|uniref:DUF6188 family protein n=1 Tax=Streptomyces sp. CA-288835 TaxID=3240069 RepID=UPI003D8E7FF0